MIPLDAGADGTGTDFGNIEAYRAGDNAILDARNCLGQTARLIGWAAQNEERQALRRLGANAGQFCEFFNQRRYWRGSRLHDAPRHEPVFQPTVRPSPACTTVL